MKPDKKRLIVGISGASGVIMGYELLKILKLWPETESHLVITAEAAQNFRLEANLTLAEVEGEADFVYDNNDLTALIASGSFAALGMIIAPCSMKTLAGIAAGYDENLLLRAADVTLKENRPLVLIPREMPLSRLHLRNLKEAADYGCHIVPPMLTFYNGADTIAKQIRHILGKALAPFSWQPPDLVTWEAVKGEVST